MNVNVAAVDLGASSGRVVLGEVGPRVLRTEAVARFPNDPVRLPDGLHWNVLELYQSALDGIGVAARQVGGDLTSVGVDAWAVDYALTRDGRMLGTPFHYRDEVRSAAGPDAVHAVIEQRDLYQRNGLQFLPFTTVYQLAVDPWVSSAERMLLIPDLMSFWLTGQEAAERTNASTTGLLEVHSATWDEQLLDLLRIPPDLMAPLVAAGDVLGSVREEVAQRLGISGLTVAAVGSHDTASAVVGVPIVSDDAAYISCGTWGLVGLELERPVLTEPSRVANFTNESGVDGRVRFLTNVIGLWLLSETMREWDRAGEPADLAQLLSAAAEVDQEPLFDVQDPTFLPPGNMATRIGAWFAERELAPPSSRPALVRSIVESLAQAFADAVNRLEELSGRAVRTLHVVGGGARNSLLCQSIADRSGRTVLAGPVEATALGNVLVQARAAGAIDGDLESLRGLISDTQEIVRFMPRAQLRQHVP